MDRDALQTVARDGCVQPVGGKREASATEATWRLRGHAWLVRAVAVTFLAGGAFISYLFFSTV